MESNKMTLHRALSELKLIDSKIEKKLSEINPVGVHVKDGLINGFIKHEEFKKNAQSDFDSIRDLIARKKVIKSKIVEANSKTTLTVASKSMTISDAITEKAMVQYKKKLVDILKKKHQESTSVLNRNNDHVENNFQELLNSALAKDNVKVDEKDVDALLNPYMEKNKFHLLDPLSVLDKIKELEAEIADFESEVDAALSEINAVTYIEI